MTGRRVTEDERDWETCVEPDCDNRVARFVAGDFYCRKHTPTAFDQFTDEDFEMIEDAEPETKTIKVECALCRATIGEHVVDFQADVERIAGVCDDCKLTEPCTLEAGCAGQRHHDGPCSPKGGTK